MRFKDAFPFRITKNAASPGEQSIRNVASRWWYPNVYSVRVNFSFICGTEVFTAQNHPDYSAIAGGIILSLPRKSPYTGTDLVDETDLAQRDCATVSPSAHYRTPGFPNGIYFDTDDAVGVGSLGNPFEGSFSLEINFHDFAEGVFSTGSGLTDSYTAGPALTFYDDETGRPEFVVTAAGFYSYADSVIDIDFASYQLAISGAGAGQVLGADEGGSVLVNRPPTIQGGIDRYDESFALTRYLRDSDEIVTTPASLTLELVETGRLSYDTTSPDLAAWDWADL